MLWEGFRSLRIFFLCLILHVRRQAAFDCISRDWTIPGPSIVAALASISNLFLLWLRTQITKLEFLRVGDKNQIQVIVDN